MCQARNFSAHVLHAYVPLAVGMWRSIRPRAPELFLRLHETSKRSRLRLLVGLEDQQNCNCFLLVIHWSFYIFWGIFSYFRIVNRIVRNALPCTSSTRFGTAHRCFASGRRDPGQQFPLCYYNVYYQTSYFNTAGAVCARLLFLVGDCLRTESSLSTSIVV